MSKSTVAFLAIIALLVIIGGVGISVLNQRQTPEPINDLNEQTKSFTMIEVSQHNSRNDCWTVISGDVYDLTDFVNSHPGGNVILRACGIDATTLFNSRQTADGQPIGSGTPHSQAAREQLAPLRIGSLK